jgi:hypothetical protein
MSRGVNNDEPIQILLYKDRAEIVRGRQRVVIPAPDPPEPDPPHLTDKMETILAAATGVWVKRKDLLLAAREQVDARGYDCVRELVAQGKLETDARKRVRRAQ